MTIEKEKNIDIQANLLTILIFGMIIFIAFFLALFFLTHKSDSINKEYNAGFQNASLQFANYTQMGYNLALGQLNNDMVSALSSYGQYRTNIIYQNQSIPIYCKVVGQ